MSDWATDQAGFMESCGQSVGEMNYKQAELYGYLVEEEAAETATALDRLRRMYPDWPDWWDELVWGEPDAEAIRLVAEAADGAIDTIYVCLGLLHSLGIDPQAAWDEVHRSNMAKIDPNTGKAIKREDGKVIKPEGWAPPDMVRVVRESWWL